ncbi:MAG: ABC transporter permease [Candidatus Bipolaricaulis sp.]|nr:ABC transporter permease [Candidatus Bipolaricaulis sp.]
MKALWKKLGRWMAGRPLAAAGAAALLAILLLALFAPWLPLQDPQSVSMRDKLLPPSAAHPMGTDDLGRDMFSRVVHGARTSLLVSVIVVACASVFGLVVGLTAGYFGGMADELMMRTTDIFLAFPGLILAMAVAVVLGPGVVPTIVALSIVWWPWYARLARSEALMHKQADFVEAARALGVPTWRILRSHILPNSLSPLIVQATLDMGYAILTTAALSFIGLGVQEPTAEWGAMLNIGRKYLLSAWWFITFPGLAIFITVLAINLAGDGLRDYLDPRTRKRGA